MKILSVSFRLATLLVLSALLIPDTPVAADDAANPEDGIEVLARGPVHEAFADPGAQQAKPSPIIPKQPPKDIEELPPLQKPEGNNVQWVSGFWAFDDESQDFIWVSGFWRDIPPGRQWMPGYWSRLADGWQWVAGFWVEAGQKEMQFLPQPPATLDNGPSVPQPAEDYSYSPGNWVYRENRYLWSPGSWLAYSPSWVWCPGRYVWTPSGYCYLNGYYDYPLENRGLLFAPVCFNRPLWDNPGWCYRPRWSICAPALLSCLWSRPNYGCYWFGNYFGARYDRFGFRPWCDNRWGGRQGYDPLYAHYRQRNRHDGRWENDLQNLYADRRAGNAAVPPRNLIQQRQLENEAVVKGEGGRGGGRFRDQTLLASLKDAERANGVKLQEVSTAKLAEQKDTIEKVRSVREQRQKIDRDIGKDGPPTKLSDAPKLAKVDLPKVEAGLKTPVTPTAIRNAKEERRAGVQEPLKPSILPSQSENKNPAAVNKPLETKPLPSVGKGKDNEANADAKPPRGSNYPPDNKAADNKPPQFKLPGENKASVPPVTAIKPAENRGADNKPPVTGLRPSETRPPVSIIKPSENKPLENKPPVTAVKPSESRPSENRPQSPVNPLVRPNPTAENRPPVSAVRPPEFKPSNPAPVQNIKPVENRPPVAPAVNRPPAPVTPTVKPPSPPAPVIRSQPPAPAPSVRPPAPAPSVRPPAPAARPAAPAPRPAARPAAPAPRPAARPAAPAPRPAARPAAPRPVSKAAPPARGGGKKK
jgi:hypothetical protein